MPTDDSSTTISLSWHAAILVVALTLFSSTVKAQDVTDQDLQDLERHVATAASLLDEQDYEAAIEEFEQAREIIDHPRLSVAVAEAYLDWQRCSQAAEEFRDLRARDDLDDDQVEAVETGLAEATDDCVELARLEVECTPGEATVHLDDRTIECPFEDDVPVGELELRADAEGHEPRHETATVEPRQTTRITLDLPASPEDEAVDWIPIVSWTSVGVGSAFLIGGAVSDYRAGRRTTLAARARDDGEHDRLEQLESEARSARIRTAVLYGAGITFVAAGLAAHFVDIDALFGPDEKSGVDYSLHFGPTGVSTTLRW